MKDGYFVGQKGPPTFVQVLVVGIGTGLSRGVGGAFGDASVLICLGDAGVVFNNLRVKGRRILHRDTRFLCYGALRRIEQQIGARCHIASLLYRMSKCVVAT